MAKLALPVHLLRTASTRPITSLCIYPTGVATMCKNLTWPAANGLKLSPQQHETGEYGWTDFVNPGNGATGCPNNGLDTGEDLDGTALHYLWCRRFTILKPRGLPLHPLAPGSYGQYGIYLNGNNMSVRPPTTLSHSTEIPLAACPPTRPRTPFGRWTMPRTSMRHAKILLSSSADG